MKYILLLTLVTLSFHVHAIQEFEAVVTDKKFNSSSTIVIDEAEIKKSRAKDLTSLLATQANISVSSSTFQPTSIFLRGGDSSHVLILVDGIPFYDAGTVQRTVSLNSLNLKSVQKIEVIKGSQSVLFGGQALSGVIKITTIPKIVKSSGLINAQLGTQQSRLFSAAGIYALDENQSFLLRANVSDRNNKSPVLNSVQIYPTRANSVEAAYVYKNENLESFVKALTSFDKTFIATSDFATFKAVDTDNFEFSTYQFSSVGSVKLLKDFYKPQVYLAFQRGARIFEQQDTVPVTNRDFLGDSLSGRIEISPLETEQAKVVLGLSITQEKLVYNEANSLIADVDQVYQGIFLKSDFKLTPDLFLETGIRTDYVKWGKSVFTYQLGLTLLKDFKLEYSTGFKRPSLTQLYAFFANPELQPEKSTSASITYETNLTTDWFFSVTGFQNEFTNLIVAKGFPTKYENIAKSKTTGVEATTGLRFEPQQLVFNLSLGYQEPRDVDQADWLVRRPLRTASFKVRKEINQFSLGAEVVHNGDRRDRMGMTANGTVEGYTYVNATAEYKYSENLSVYARGQNITNYIYETSHGYYDEGQNYVLGAEYTF